MRKWQLIYFTKDKNDNFQESIINFKTLDNAELYAEKTKLDCYVISKKGGK